MEKDALINKIRSQKWLNFDEDGLRIDKCEYVRDGYEIYMKDGRVVVYNALLDSYHLFLNKDEYVHTYTEPAGYERTFRFKFARSFYELLAKSGMTQDDLACETDINSATISRYMNGEVTPSAFNVYKIARALGCSIEDLINF